MSDDDLQPESGAELQVSALVGLTEADAVRRTREAGLDPQVVPPGVTALTMDFRARRVRLFLDDSGVVERATAG
jgi:hypothetical protein